MTRVAQAFPRGPRDFAFQVAVWLGFGLAYQVARGVADRDPLQALQNGRHVIDLERALHSLVEVHIQRVVLHAGDLFLQTVNYTYWISQFTVLTLALLWVYFRRNEVFLTVRNWLLATNVLALAGYVLMPTAPPRFFTGDGFVDTLALVSGLGHDSGVVQLAANPYAAMPSVHAADALVIGFVLAALVRNRALKILWTLWPTWVWFCVMASGNHFWLDVAAGIGTALLAATMLQWADGRRRAPTAALLSARR
jgi:hypothetical protein